MSMLSGRLGATSPHKRVQRALRWLGLDVHRVAEPRSRQWALPRASRFLYFKRALDMVRELDGDVVECGVGRGESLIDFTILCNQEKRQRKVWGFDSFEGFPEPTEHDTSPRHARKGDVWSNTSMHVVLSALRDAGFSPDYVEANVTLVKGFFDESLGAYTGKAIAVLHLDCDLYASYKGALEQLFPKVVPGGIILFDEYMNSIDHLKFPGARKAIDEFLGDQARCIRRDADTGNYYYVKEG